MVVALYDTRVTPGHEEFTTIIPFVGSVTLYFTFPGIDSKILERGCCWLH
jgi:hypothetical protein